jgi:hypothetical protein
MPARVVRASSLPIMLVPLQRQQVRPSVVGRGVFNRLNDWIYQSHGVSKQRTRKPGLFSSPVEVGNAKCVRAAHHGQAHLA